LSAATVTLIIAIIGCVIGVLGFFRNSKNDTALDAEWKGCVMEQLKQMNQTLSEMRAIQADQNNKLLEYENRITRLETKI
jgi:hypothetical protein